MKTLFQYCQKIIVLSRDHEKVLLCRRKGEADYDGIFSFIGGKMERSDESILAALKREKDEEVGKDFRIRICTTYTHNVLYIKKDGTPMVLPHYLAVHVSGDVVLSEEYSEYKWIPIKELESFEPKVQNIPETVNIMRKFIQEASVEI